MYLKQNMRYKNIHRTEKFKNIQEARVEKHTFSRTIQDQIEFKNIQKFQGPVNLARFIQTRYS